MRTTPSGCRAGLALLGRTLDPEAGRAEVLADHRTLSLVFGVTLLVSLVCPALLPGRSQPAVPASVRA